MRPADFAYMPYPVGKRAEQYLWVRGQLVDNPCAKAVLRTLVDYDVGATGGPMWPCIETISRETALSAAGVRKALARLCAQGWIKKGRRHRRSNGTHGSFEYSIAVDRAETAPY